MKFNKSKCQILHLGQGSPDYMCELEDERLERNPAERDRGVWVDGRLSMSKHCTLTGKRASHVLERIKHSIVGRSMEVVVPLYTALMQPLWQS